MSKVVLIDPPKTLTLSETLLAMDIADSIRHGDRMREFEMTEGDRRKAAVERLRMAYEAQGDVVPDHVLERAIKEMNESRFVHKTLPSGPRRLMWTGFARRGRYTRNLAIALTALVVGYGALNTGYEQFVLKPRREADARLAIQIDDVIPRNLASAVEYADGFAKRLGDDAALGRIAVLRSSVDGSLASRDAAAAEQGISLIRAVGEELKHREDGVKLVAQVDDLTSAQISQTKDAGSRDALVDIATQMRDAALKGDIKGYEAAAERFKSLSGYILTPYRIQIVDRPGISAGVELTDNETGVPAWYLIVEAVSPSGVVKPLEIKDRNRKPTRTVATWGIRVTKSAFEKVRTDKRADNVIDDNIAGLKPAGTLRVDWNVDDVNDQTINYWVEPKKQGARTR